MQHVIALIIVSETFAAGTGPPSPPPSLPPPKGKRSAASGLQSSYGGTNSNSCALTVCIMEMPRQLRSLVAAQPLIWARGPRSQKVAFIMARIHYRRKAMKENSLGTVCK